ncbi:MAG: TRAP transporter small permease [Clostridiales Family XIII bacterium]|jgi:TRAP-type C4-dicarboxylate transport system permease small subunit|nr:TRAP transporter small permease [Clostridiales Family XIII bacterium]
MINKILDMSSSAFEKIAAGVLILVGISTMANILLRTIFNISIPGAIEIVQYGMLTANALALGRAGYLDRHIAVTQLIDWFPARLGSVFYTLVNLVSAGIFGYISYTYFVTIPHMIDIQRSTDTFKIPMYIFYGIMAVAFLLATLVYVYYTAQHAKKIIKPEPKKGKDEEPVLLERDMIV